MTAAPSRFTPSLMPATQLEQLFVARHHLLDGVMERIKEAATSESRNHTLFVGPRGAGKTHLVALVHHRVTGLAAEGLGVEEVWLPEDPWAIASLRHLLVQIIERLTQSPHLPRGADVEDLLHLIEQRANAAGPIVVLIENLDQVLDQIGVNGQGRLRHFLQTSGALLIVATSTVLSRSLSDQARPFYGFFSTVRLDPFSVEEATQMLVEIARSAGNAALVDYLGDEEARARLRAIKHLAGGQPRLWAALASSLTVEGLRELVDVLVERFDDLTPYYQSLISQLSPQQRLIVVELASADRAIHVAELADRLEMTPRSAAAAVSDLSEAGWIVKVSPPAGTKVDRRRTYYELAEPLVRIAFQIKASRGEPLRLVVEFLQWWFEPADLVDVEELDLHAYRDAARAALKGDPVAVVVRELHGLARADAPARELRGRVDDAMSALGMGSADAYLALPSAVRSALESRLADDGPSAVGAIRLQLQVMAGAEVSRQIPVSVDRDGDAWVARAENLVAQSRGPWELLTLAIAYALAGRLFEAESAYEAASEEDAELRSFVDWQFERAATLIGFAAPHLPGTPDDKRDWFVRWVRRGAEIGMASGDDKRVARAEQGLAVLEAFTGSEAPADPA